jgi:hexosaminidase
MLKKYTYMIFIALMFNIHYALAQNHIEPSDASKLQITWSVIENHYQTKEQNQSVLTIQNNSLNILPASGWKLYFNLGRDIKPQLPDSKLQISHVNGDLYYIYPTANFTGLIAKSKFELACLSGGSVINREDAPQGFYLVWDNDPGKAIPLNDVKVIPPSDLNKLKRFANDELTSSAQLYKQNERAAKFKNYRICKIFPQPASYIENPGFFTIGSKTIIAFDAAFKGEATLLAADLQNILGYKPSMVSNHFPKGSIILLKDTSITAAYKLAVSPSGIIISAKDATGVFYGIQSLKTLIDPSYYAAKSKSIRVQCVQVIDKPAFGFRGVMLDVARNFQPKAEIIKLIDLLALYKFNTLHLHLNDDEGWRLEIPTLPELTDVGSKRGYSINPDQYLLPAYGSGPDANIAPGSGYYTKAQFIAILQYATQRHIDVIPEIETPGHARAAIKSMNNRYKRFMVLGDSVNANKYLLQMPNDSSVYHSVQKWDDNVIDVALPSAYSFLTVVTDEIISMYKQAGAPLNTIHFGGDEVPVGAWEKSAAFNALRTKDSTVKSSSDLWPYFFNRIDRMLEQRGLYFSGWEETAQIKANLGSKRKWEPNPQFADRNFHVNVWNNQSGNEDLAYRLANFGYKVVLSFVSNFYLDMAYTKDFDQPGVNWGGFTNLEVPFQFIPFDYLRNKKTDYLGRPLSKETIQNAAKLTPTGEQNILGIEGHLWTETVKSTGRLEYMYLPRLLALAERSWVKQPDWMLEKDSLKANTSYDLDWVSFVHATSRELSRLDQYAGGYNYRIPTPAFKIERSFVYVNTDVPGFQIRYTTDGTMPNFKSKLYLAPIPDKGKIVLRAFNKMGRGSEIIKLENKD